MFSSDRLITALYCRLLCIFLCNLFLLICVLFLVLRGVFMNMSIVFLFNLLVLVFVLGVYVLVMHCIISDVCVFGLEENNIFVNVVKTIIIIMFTKIYRKIYVALSASSQANRGRQCI
jgi:hypothetical protein